MENQRTNGFDGQLHQDEKVGFSKIEVSAPKPISITLPYGTTIKLDTRDVGGYFGSNSATHFGLLVPGISDQIVPLESVELV